MMWRRKQGSLGLLLAIAAAIFVVSSSGLRCMLGPTTCRDGWASPSIGIQGACSWHGGVDHSKEIFAFYGGITAVVGFGFAVAGWVSRRSRSDSVSILCHLCGAPMRRRIARRGKNAGRAFLGCSRFPHCRATQPLAAPSKTA